ncbi:MAG TPA: FAD binding domain-containing protein [Gaiellaceae bacterium]|nr:FAD binding domain-containing protein [Gaiellaceae bacterium]HZT54106.1 FAD binding domain-containing protein [Gaiellaceae bacterium]
MTAATDVLLPASPDEAVSAFGDGSGLTVVGGGTIVMPEIAAGRLRPARALLLARAGLAGVTRDGATVTIGSMTSVQDLVGLAAPVGPCAANIADIEVRSQATLGGNLCAGQGQEAPRGDLQGPLLAVGASVRSAGSGGVRSEPLEEFLAHRAKRLVLDVRYDEPAAGAFVALDRPHTHEYTALAVSAARLADGSVRLAATGAGWWGRRLPSAEALAGDPEAAGRAALADVEMADDALASAWYREQALPVLVRRALARLEEAA